MKLLHTLPADWKNALEPILKRESFQNLMAFIDDTYKEVSVFPKSDEIFNAFLLTPVDAIKVVIIGQDPYHGENEAHGLSFSVNGSTKIPPSLRNIFKELETEYGTNLKGRNGSLENWARQGVFLLNSVLTVEKDKPLSHKGKGWEDFTDFVIQTISAKNTNVVFMLWGNYAKKKVSIIDTKKHLILKAAHPSPFSAHTGFFGCNHFKKCNAYLRKYGKSEILWT